MEQKTTNEMWTRIINDARFYDGSPQMLMQLISHFEAQGYVLSQKCEQCNVSGSLPLAELQELKNTVNVLLLFAESDGEIVNGYRTKEIVQELKKLCGNDR